ncbi:hypothetical protein [Novosphingobium sp.]|uniref:hypothetical protein n=1 Tax=Novosphingobium sp. TaxID=1874826 RepID=UPI00286D8F78|nr:hypothetical protein [Novosphingobium sp.]
MTKLAPTTSPLALAAILAASAIPFTAASAQEAGAPAPAPVIVLPPVDAAPAAPAPAPVIVLPDVTTPPAAAQAAPEPAASPSARAEPRAANKKTTRSSSRTTETSSPSAVAGPAASEPPTIVPPVTVPDAATDPIAQPVAADPAPVAEAPAAPAEDNGWLIPLALGGMAVGGGIAYAATAGKRRRKTQPADAAVYRDTRNEGRAPIRAPLATSSLAATFAGADARREANPEVVPAGTPTYAADGPAGATPAAARRFNEPARIPAGPVPTGAERQALIERMVSAAPDASNPFHSRKTRRKRARIMLASAEHRQRTAATEPFDFRSYAPFSEQETVRTGGQQAARIKETVN